MSPVADKFVFASGSPRVLQYDVGEEDEQVLTVRPHPRSQDSTKQFRSDTQDQHIYLFNRLVLDYCTGKQ